MLGVYDYLFAWYVGNDYEDMRFKCLQVLNEPRIVYYEERVYARCFDNMWCWLRSVFAVRSCKENGATLPHANSSYPTLITNALGIHLLLHV
jgi:hypothetical protein